MNPAFLHKKKSRDTKILPNFHHIMSFIEINIAKSDQNANRNESGGCFVSSVLICSLLANHIALDCFEFRKPKSGRRFIFLAAVSAASVADLKVLAGRLDGALVAALLLHRCALAACAFLQVECEGR